jgi:RNA polymerase sigma-70 factor, ECF subfamily
MEYSFQQLLRGIKDGDIHAFEFLYKEYYVLLCYVARHIIRNDDDAEEIVSDVFVKLWNNRDTVNITSSLKSYLIRAVRNTALNYLDKVNATRKFTDQLDKVNYDLLFWDNDYPLGQLYEKEIIEAINRGIAELPNGCREIFLLSRDDELSYNDIAMKLNISVNTVKTQMKIALSRLRVTLRNYLDFIILIMGAVI